MSDISTQRKKRNYAVLSKVAYQGDADEKKIQKELSKYRLGRIMEYVPSLSNGNHTTFYNKRTGKAIIAYRGTNVSDPKDLLTDAAIFFGVERMTPRFADAVDTAEKAQKMFGKKNVEVTGHSLGGSQAMYVSSRMGLPSYAYNPGKTFRQFDLLNRYDQVRDFFCPKCDKMSPDNTTVYTTGWDPISWGASREEASIRYVNPKQLDVHGIDNFIEMERRAVN